MPGVCGCVAWDEWGWVGWTVKTTICCPSAAALLRAPMRHHFTRAPSWVGGSPTEYARQCMGGAPTHNGAACVEVVEGGPPFYFKASNCFTNKAGICLYCSFALRLSRMLVCSLPRMLARQLHPAIVAMAFLAVK